PEYPSPESRHRNTLSPTPMDPPSRRHVLDAPHRKDFRTEDDMSDMLIVGGGASWVEFAAGVVNARGSFIGPLLAINNQDHKPIVQVSLGIHITLHNY
ncbi:hypothetical protein EIP91_005776, partial [Steccherinum ochraceum]